jgi:hypothetical protein
MISEIQTREGSVSRRQGSSRLCLSYQAWRACAGEGPGVGSVRDTEGDHSPGCHSDERMWHSCRIGAVPRSGNCSNCPGGVWKTTGRERGRLLLRWALRIYPLYEGGMSVSLAGRLEDRSSEYVGLVGRSEPPHFPCCLSRNACTPRASLIALQTFGSPSKPLGPLSSRAGGRGRPLPKLFLLGNASFSRMAGRGVGRHDPVRRTVNSSPWIVGLAIQAGRSVPDAALLASPA